MTLLQKCLQGDPDQRPGFGDVVKEMQALIPEDIANSFAQLTDDTRLWEIDSEPVDNEDAMFQAIGQLLRRGSLSTAMLWVSGNMASSAIGMTLRLLVLAAYLHLSRDVHQQNLTSKVNGIREGLKSAALVTSLIFVRDMHQRSCVSKVLGGLAQ